jgi:carboxypeptidase Q
VKVKRIYLAGLFSLLTAVSSVHAQEPVYWDVVQEIMEEGFENSDLMENVGWMTDVFGPRLARSPAYRAAAEWAKKKLEEYDLDNVHLDQYELGIGWNLEYTSVHMMAPQYMPIIAYPQAWSSPTEGKIRGPAVYINFQEISSEKDLAHYKGTLRNSIIFTVPKQKMYPRWKPDALLLTDEQLDKMAEIPTTDEMAEKIRIIPRLPELDRRVRPTYQYPRRKIIDFLLSEGIAAIVSTDGFYDDGTVQVTNVAPRAWSPDAPTQPTSFIFAAEHYNRIMRILERDIPVELEVELRASYSEKDLMGHNVIAEIPGTDLADEVVIAAAHFDGTISGTGTEDNATGAGHVMEAARILKAIGVKPRRTIRFALWDGHEVGHSGARAYLAQHYVNPETGEQLPDYEKLAGYYNLDYGTGKIRGIYLMNNLRAKPIFTEWMKPFHDMGMKHSFFVASYDASTEGYDTVGLPAFKFCQDQVENDMRSYHTNMDVYDRLIPEYFKQGAVIVASFLYHTAMRDEKLPGAPGQE